MMIKKKKKKAILFYLNQKLKIWKSQMLKNFKEI